MAIFYNNGSFTNEQITVLNIVIKFGLVESHEHRTEKKTYISNIWIMFCRNDKIFKKCFMCNQINIFKSTVDSSVVLRAKIKNNDYNDILTKS